MKSSEGKIETWQDADAWHIDVRGLIPPQPMIAILSLLKSGKITNRLVVHIDRDPVHLYAELEELGWEYETSISDGDQYLIKIERPDVK
jgi:uncharacterized protein (DUF2249 family)